MNFARRQTLAAILLVALLAPHTFAAEDAKPKLKGLIVAGGCCHDYPRQKLIISEGLSQRISIAWDIVHEGDENGKTHKVSVYAKPNWSDGYDVVIHNECFGAIEDVDFVEGIVNEHKRSGVAAVFVHCAMHSYRAAQTDEWRKLIGVTSRRHERAKRSLDVRNLAADHPIMAGFPEVWKTPNGELYVIENIWPNCTPLAAAYSPETESDQPCIWINNYDNVRIFGTTLGHHNETMMADEWLDTVSRGVLWAVNQLNADGKPAEGYAGTGKASFSFENAAGPSPKVADWSKSIAFPSGEKPVALFNGKDFTGWKGHTDKYFSIQDGVIVAKNDAENAPQVSTYLLTEKKYRNFRLVYEGKLVESKMHSGIALWGKKFDKDGESHSYQGHLVMFPSNWGFYDLFRRNSIYKDDGRAKKADRVGDWNRMEILAIGNRIRLAVNGQEVADWADPMPEYCEAGPIGLQLHSNKVPQEVHFRGLILSEDPEDRLITVSK